MRLTKVTLWNYRSYWSDDDNKAAVDISFAPGVNYVVGPNNVGKSNLLRAIALALDPKGQPDPERDLPVGKKGKLGIDLQFEVGTNRSRAVESLLNAVEKYEETFQVPAEMRTAAHGIIRLHVRYLYGQRSASLQNPDVDPRKSLAKHRDALEKFHDVIRFVDIHSGEDLKALLQRGFKEILANALGAEHGKAMKAAEDAREQYVKALSEVLRPVGKHVEERLDRYVRDVEGVDLLPRVPSVQDALADADVFIKDAVRTALDQKGTGVRGAMLLLLMSFIADSAKSAVVFGIEEPEAFLHPAAHRELGESLERFTQREDVSLLVTTHSPFIFRDDKHGGHSAVFLVRKGPDGRSSIGKDLAESARMDLLGSRVLTLLLQKGDEIREGTKLVLVVEGYTDRRYMELAALRLGIDLDGIHIVNAGGAVAAAVQTATLRGMHSADKLVVALFDGDDDGRTGAKILLDKFNLKKKTDVLCYDQWIEPGNVAVEAEDIFGKATMDAFLGEPGNDAYLDERKRRPKSDLWHIGLTKDGKGKFVEWLEQKATPAMFEGWIKPLEYIRKLVTDQEERAAKKAAHLAGQKFNKPEA